MAGRHGLYAGTVYKPRKIKEEESQRWVVLGCDPDAVDRLVDCQRKDVVRQLELESAVPGVGAIAPPINVTCVGPSFLKMLVIFLSGLFFGGMIFFYMLVYVL